MGGDFRPFLAEIKRVWRLIQFWQWRHGTVDALRVGTGFPICLRRGTSCPAGAATFAWNPHRHRALAPGGQGPSSDTPQRRAARRGTALAQERSKRAHAPNSPDASPYGVDAVPGTLPGLLLVERKLMTRNVLLALGVATAVALASPAPAAAQASVTPFAGATFGADAPKAKLTTGLAVTYMGRFAGVEAELGYTPDFFAENSSISLVDTSNVTTVMGNLLVGYGHSRVKPYAAVGAGLLRSRVTSGSTLFDDVSTNSFGFNAGAGLMGLLGEHVGLRGDIRYFRSLQDDDPDDDFDLSVGNFDFWRAYAGVTFSF
jgi:hypothetical protein